MGEVKKMILSPSERREYVRQRYNELLSETRERDPLQFRYTAKGYYIEKIAAETLFSMDYVGRIINGSR